MTFPAEFVTARVYTFPAAALRPVPPVEDADEEPDSS